MISLTPMVSREELEMLDSADNEKALPIQLRPQQT